jgi:crossover junction endodeoxyribonuclease RusA
MIEFTLPWPPSVNHYYRRLGHKTLISRDGRKYRTEVVAQLFDMLDEPMSGRLQVEIHAHPPDKRRRDLDNLQKSLLDAMQHAGVYVDDSQIDSLSIYRCNTVTNGAVKLKIWETPCAP